MLSRQMTRRTLLKTGAGAAAFAATGNILTPSKTFAARDQKLIFWLQPNFNKAADDILEAQTMAYAKQAGLKDTQVQILKVPGGEVSKKMAAALEVGAPPDVTRGNEEQVVLWSSQGHLSDLADLVSEMQKTPGGVNTETLKIPTRGGKVYAAPMGLNPVAVHARMDLLEKAGYNDFPATWERFIEACLKINNPPFYAYGMALGLTPSDSLVDVLSVVWPHGGKMVDEQDRPAFNSAGSVKAFELIRDMYHKHKIIPRGTLSWDNSGNNKAYQSGQVAFVFNPTSIYSTLLRENKSLADRTGLFPAPGGPAGRFKTQYTDYYTVFNKSPYPDVAKGFVRYVTDPKNYQEFILGAGGRYLPVYPAMTELEFFRQPVFRGLLDIAKEGVTQYWPGTLTPALSEVITQSVVIKGIHQMLVNNVDPAKAVASVQEEIITVYKRMGQPV